MNGQRKRKTSNFETKQANLMEKFFFKPTVSTISSSLVPCARTSSSEVTNLTPEDSLVPRTGTTSFETTNVTTEDSSVHYAGTTSAVTTAKVASAISHQHFSCLSRDGKAEFIKKGPDRHFGPFPKSQFGNQYRSFLSSWYDRFNWIEYFAEKNMVGCFLCKLLSTTKEKNGEFIDGKVCNWKKFVQKAQKHEESLEHKKCVHNAKILLESAALNKSTLQERLVETSNADKEKNRKGICLIFEIIRWLTTQNIALRGHIDCNGNFQSFIQTFRAYMPDLDHFLSLCPKNAQYMSWKIQNEIIEITDKLVVEEVVKPIITSKKPFSVIMDKTTDLSTKLQIAISIRFTNENTGIPEEFLVAMVEGSSSTGKALATIVLQVLSELGLNMDQLIGQGYDGGSNMRGDIQGVQARIKEKCPRAIYTWCWSHNLQLVMSHAVEGSPAASECFDKMKEVYAIVSSSSQRTAIMQRHILLEDMLLDETAEEADEISRTEHEIATVIDHELEDKVTDDKSTTRESHYRRLLSISGTRFIARTRNLRIYKNKLPQIKTALLEMGLPAVAKSLNDRFKVTVEILYMVMCPVSDLSQKLQSPDLNLLDAHNYLLLLKSYLRSLRTEDEFRKLISTVTEEKLSTVSEIDMVSNSKRIKRITCHFKNSILTQALPMYSEQFQNKILLREYFQILDIVEEQVESRFSHPSLAALSALQNGKMTDELRDFCQLHSMDISSVERQLKFVANGLRHQLSLDTSSPLSLSDLFLSSKVQNELHYIIDVALALPVTSASAERAFSRLRLIKNHLRTTMSSKRLQSMVRISANRHIATKLHVNNFLHIFKKSERRILF